MVSCLVGITILLSLSVWFSMGSPLSVITSNNPHGRPLPLPTDIESSLAVPNSSNLPPAMEWDLYDKEVGTWCAPDSTSESTTTIIPPQLPAQQQIGIAKSLPDEEQLDRKTVVNPSLRGGPFPNLPTSKTPTNETQMLTRWVDAALRVIRSHAMSTACRIDEVSCRDPRNLSLTNRPLPSGMNLYVAMPTTQGKMVAVLPDGALTKIGARDGWLLLDPSPKAAFGHNVYVFAIDFNITDSTCLSNGGVPLDVLGECLTQIFKNRCPNLVVRRSTTWRRRSASSRRCEVDFLPLVHIQNQVPSQIDQRLLCNSDVPGFAPCPELRTLNETSELICDPLSTNHKRCDSTHELVKTRCRLFETCDQAVLLSGGWNWQLSGKREAHQLLSMYRMLRHNGFGKQSIKIFFANGVRAGIESSEEDSEFLDTSSIESDGSQTFYRHEHNHHNSNPAMYPAALKIALRNHIRTLCGTSHCVDSFVIYLASSTRSDGSSFLWDADHNGEFDDTEIYTIREFMRDIQDCAARQVVVLADQNNSGLLADALIRSKRHTNVLVFTSGHSQQLSWFGEFTHHWTKYSHGHACLSQVFQDSLNVIKYSQPRFEDLSNGTVFFNLFGAPCDVKPPFSRHELKTHYMGCQYVPTRVWLSRHGTATDPPPRLISG